MNRRNALILLLSMAASAIFMSAWIRDAQQRAFENALVDAAIEFIYGRYTGSSNLQIENTRGEQND